MGFRVDPNDMIPTSKITKKTERTPGTNAKLDRNTPK